MLSIRSFVKKFNNEEILSIGSLVLHPGIYFIKGDNGSGKTTLFKCIAGISPCTGEISLDGHTLADHPVTYRSLVNFAEAEPVYPSFLTAKDLLYFVGKAKRASKEQLDHYVGRLGIDHFYHKPCGSYSSGMLKKLSLALAFLGKPRMIILDEPLTTLDATTRKILFGIIEEKKDILFLLSSHHTLDTTPDHITATYKITNKSLVAESHR